MANVEHSTLTTTNLHENKGVSTATDNTVATAVSGATVWAKLTASNLTGTGNSFGAQIFHIQDQKTSGTAAQSLTNATWNKRDLTTSVTNEIASASLASNQITLPAGTYYLEAASAWTDTAQVSQKGGRLRLRNVTDGTTTGLGIATLKGQSGTGATVQATGISTLRVGRFIIAGTKTFEIQMYVNDTTMTGGQALSTGENEIYTDVAIWKIA